MATKTYDGDEIGQMKAQPEVMKPDQESAYSGAKRAYEGLGSNTEGKTTDAHVSPAHETDRKSNY